VAALLEQRVATSGRGDWCGWRLRGLFHGNRYRWYDLGDRRLLRGLGGEPRAMTRALLAIALAFLGRALERGI
jgi:hypothetical protein